MGIFLYTCIYTGIVKKKTCVLVSRKKPTKGANHRSDLICQSSWIGAKYCQFNLKSIFHVNMSKMQIRAMTSLVLLSQEKMIK